MCNQKGTTLKETTLNLTKTVSNIFFHVSLITLLSHLVYLSMLFSRQLRRPASYLVANLVLVPVLKMLERYCSFNVNSSGRRQAGRNASDYRSTRLSILIRNDSASLHERTFYRNCVSSTVSRPDSLYAKYVNKYTLRQ